MVKHAWSVFAQNSVIDERTKLLSIQSIYESVTIDIPGNEIPKEIDAPVNGELISYLFRSNSSTTEKASIGFELISPSGEALTKNEILASLPKGKKNFRIVGQIKVLKFKEAGDYVIEIKLNGKTVQELPLEVLMNTLG